MSSRLWIAIACALAGVPLAAYGLAQGAMLIALVGLALVLVFVFLAVEAVAGANRPKRDIPKAADAAWHLKDQPPGEQR
jgi:uncharacterized membrane protein